jgi:leader peptidase (prepilin peptidase)/N-methyltransferase
LGVYLFYATVLVIIFVVEMEHQLVLNVVSYPAMAAAFGLSWLLPDIGPLRSIVGGAFGMVTLALPFGVYRKRGMFGLGDVILGAMLGLMVGWPVIVMVLLVSAVCAAATAVFLMISRGRKRTDVIPFGPFLAAATVLALFWGQTVSDWVLSAIP